MKRLGAAVGLLTALVGCRSSQPATNPFLRTTVPPPATAPAVVTPGEPFTPGVVPPPATPAVVAPPPAVSPVPVQPAPMIAPPKEKFDPPGGSFQYHQSSIDRGRYAPPAGVSLASHTQQAGALPASPPSVPSPLGQRGVAAVAPANVVQGNWPSPPAGVAQPPPNMTASSAIRVANPTATSPSTAPAAIQSAQVSTSAAPIFRAAASASDVQSGSVPASGSAPVTGRTAAMPSTAEVAGYGHAPDYSWLRGKLEYSQTSQQWKLRYIPIDGQTDQYGGSVKLPGSAALTTFQPGDLVLAQGVLTPGSSTADSYAPLYQLARLERQPR